MSLKLSQLRKVAAEKLLEFLPNHKVTSLGLNNLNQASLPKTLKVDQENNFKAEFVYENFAVAFPQMLKFSSLTNLCAISPNIFNVYNRIVINFGQVSNLTEKDLLVALIMSQHYDASKEA